jgi:hypothetical protein
MGLSRRTTRYFMRTLYAGELVTVTLLKRGDDQQQGTVTQYVLYGCRRGKIHNTGEQIQHDFRVGTQTFWHIPREQLDRNGILYINALDRIIDGAQRWWQPEAPTPVRSQLFEQHLCISCLRVDPFQNVVLNTLLGNE